MVFKAYNFHGLPQLSQTRTRRCHETSCGVGPANLNLLVIDLRTPIPRRLHS